MSALRKYEMELLEGVEPASTHQTLLLGDWLVKDYSDCWWSLCGDRIAHSYDRADLVSSLAGGYSEATTYSEGPVWVVRRSPSGLVWISTDGRGVNVYHADRERNKECAQ